MTLHGGRAVVTGRRSDESLYDFNLATYDTGDTFDQSLAKGFVELWGLPSKIAAERDERLGPRPWLTRDRLAGQRLWGGRFEGGPSDAMAALSLSCTSTGGSRRTTSPQTRAHARVLHRAGLLDRRRARRR